MSGASQFVNRDPVHELFPLPYFPFISVASFFRSPRLVAKLFPNLKHVQNTLRTASGLISSRGVVLLSRVSGEKFGYCRIII